jgi:hypothetical protein
MPKRKNTTKRGQTFDVTTVEGFIDWHQQNVRDLEKTFEGSAVAAACWFAAYATAEEMCESNTVKAWARLILDGIPRLNNQPALTQWLADEVRALEEEEEDGEPPRDRLLQQLRNFWLDGSK